MLGPHSSAQPIASWRIWTLTPAEARSLRACANCIVTFPSVQTKFSKVIERFALEIARSIAGKMSQPLQRGVTEFPSTRGGPKRWLTVRANSGSPAANPGLMSCLIFLSEKKKFRARKIPAAAPKAAVITRSRNPSAPAWLRFILSEYPQRS